MALRVNGRPGERTRFEHEPKFCPQCGGSELEDVRWYSKDGGMLMAECAAQCGCHFGVSGVWFDPEDADEDPCDHAWAAAMEPGGEFRAGIDRSEICFKCGVDKSN